jgi:hypothetical protein
MAYPFHTKKNVFGFRKNSFYKKQKAPAVVARCLPAAAVAASGG